MVITARANAYVDFDFNRTIVECRYEYNKEKNKVLYILIEP